MSAILNIVESAYRGTVEEQDDTILWVSQVFRAGGDAVTVLLRANAVNYIVRGQDASGLSFGNWTQTQPPRLDQDIERLIAKGVRVLYIAEDAHERGISDAVPLVPGVRAVDARALAPLFEEHDYVWYW
jgi:hypothetical protein